MDISGAQETIDANKSLITACRSARVPVIYLQMGYDVDLKSAGGPSSPNYHKELGMVLMREQPEHAGKVLTHGSWDWEIIDELRPQPDDIVIEKSRYNGFQGTDLSKTLQELGVRHLLFTGIATNICVESTARAAYFEDYWPILISDAMNHAGPDFVRQATIWNFEKVFGWVTTCNDVIECLKKN